MSKSGKKRAPAVPAAAAPARPGMPPAPARARTNPRLQADNRWQRTKRYGWDSR